MDYEAILRNYYGDNIVIERNVPVENSLSATPDVTLRSGDTGADIELLQRRLNRISVNYPGIPKIFPVDGYFGESTENAVRKFQEVFGLTVDGLVGRATWNEILFIYNAVKRLYELNSEGLSIADITTSYVTELSEGSSGEGVLTVQYYLSYIAQFVPTVTAVAYDGSFGPATADAVRSFQGTYSLPVTGIVDRLTWDRMENVYYGYVRELDYEFRVGRILPYPGRIITAGTEGSDVRVLQEYLNYIASAYPDIPRVNVDGVYGPATEAQVQAFRQLFNMPSESRRVTAPLWAAIANVYDDIYVGNGVRSGQYPGYSVG